MTGVARIAPPLLAAAAVLAAAQLAAAVKQPPQKKFIEKLFAKAVPSKSKLGNLFDKTYFLCFLSVRLPDLS